MLTMYLIMFNYSAVTVQRAVDTSSQSSQDDNSKASENKSLSKSDEKSSSADDPTERSDNLLVDKDLSS